jgi:uncharacterized repeat protein (TIGR03803 family)
MCLFLQRKSRHTAVVAVLAPLLTAAIGLPPAGAGERVVHNFVGGSDGAAPFGSLIADGAGNQYGTTEVGGSGTDCYGGKGCGTIFELSQNGTEQVLYNFQGGNDGFGPTGVLLMDQSGNLFGATLAGGGCSAETYGCGTIFKLAPDGTETVLYAFQEGSDGAEPEGNLVADAAGNLYGVANGGGSYNGTACENDGCGTVFELEPNGTEITLHTFQGGSDGGVPLAGLIIDSSGNLYGTTFAGGACNMNAAGCGTVFKVAPGGTETVLYAFKEASDGGFPESVLIEDNAGNLYGTTFDGGDTQACYPDGCGAVFKLTPGGRESVLYDFKFGNDGSHPAAGVVMDGGGNFYGTTYYGGGRYCKKDGCGTVFEVTPKGNENVLYAFRSTHGRYPVASLLLGAHGDLYGTTSEGGIDNDGLVFRLKK